MTEYRTSLEIYVETLRHLVDAQTDEATVMARIASVSEMARRERDAANEPGFVDPCVSYIPAYGAEDQIAALQDYCDLKRITDRSKTLRFLLQRLLNEADL